MEIFLEIENSQDEIPRDDPNISGILSMEDLRISYPVYQLNSKGEIFNNSIHVGNRFHIANPKDMQDILNTDISSDLKYVFVSTEEWQIIPLENVIAKYRKAGVKIIGKLNTEDEIDLFPKILEVGIDGFLVSPKDYIIFQEKLTVQKIPTQIVLQEFEVTHVEPTGNGDRVCVDTFSILQEGEGLLIGSTSRIFALIEAEVHESGFVRARPFRVNAGVVSLYTLNHEKTNYLSELSAGSSVTIVNRNGDMRKELVARIKIEKRPMVLIRVKYEEKEYPIVLQNAETVRLVTKDSSIPITVLKVGDKILCHSASGARHFGHSVDEFVEER